MWQTVRVFFKEKMFRGKIPSVDTLPAEISFAMSQNFPILVRSVHLGDI
jgi:hypothetical protein